MTERHSFGALRSSGWRQNEQITRSATRETTLDHAADGEPRPIADLGELLP